MNQWQQPPLVDDDGGLKNRIKRLKEMCIQSIAEDGQRILFDKNKYDASGDNIRSQFMFPTTIADAMLKSILSCDKYNKDEVLQLFSNTSRFSVRNCIMRNSDVHFNTIDKFQTIQNIQCIDLFQVQVISNTTVNKSIMQLLVNDKIRAFHLHSVSVEGVTPPLRFQFISNQSSPNLQSLRLNDSIHAWFFIIDARNPPKKLTSLELSFHKEKKTPEEVYRAFNYSAMMDVDANDFVEEDDEEEGEIDDRGRRIVTQINLENPLLKHYKLESLADSLRSLILHRTPLGRKDFDVIFKLSKLQHLDISYCCPTSDSTEGSSPSYWEILDSLPMLSSLDISGNNIAWNLYRDAKRERTTGDKHLERDPPRRLDFLGLFNSQAAEIINIAKLAEQIAGDNGEAQLLTAAQRYMDRPKELVSVFHKVYYIIEDNKMTCPRRMFKLLLEALFRHRDDERVLEATTSVIFHITRPEALSLDPYEKRNVVEAALLCLKEKRKLYGIVHNALIMIYNMDFRTDIFNYHRVTMAILDTVIMYEYAESPQTPMIAVHLLNAIVCGVSNEVKLKIAQEINFVEIIMQRIRNKLNDEIADDIMMTCWGALWNISDETPFASKQFIDLGGFKLITDCIARFRERTELRNNIMGLVGNLAEVKELRPYLMTNDLLDLWFDLATNPTEEERLSQNMEIQYNACGTLAHLLSDGPDVWTVTSHSRDEVRKGLYDAVESWDLRNQRRINYRSFEPILKLIQCEVPEAVHWSVWALANLLRFQANYCEVLIEEEGRDVLVKVFTMQDITDRTKELANELIKKYDEYPRDFLKNPDRQRPGVFDHRSSVRR